MYLAPDINKVLIDNEKMFHGKLTYTTIVRRLGRIFDHPRDLKFKFETFSDIPENDFTVSGLYDMFYDKKYVILNFSNKQNTINLDRYTVEPFFFLVSQTIQHEAIHQHQWANREPEDEACKLDFRIMNGTIQEEREYLSDIDEIDAYAHDIAMEIKRYYAHRDPYEVLKNIQRTRKLHSYNYDRRTFSKCDWDKIKKQLFKKTYNWIPHA
jgi:hypothetical protein